MTITSSICYKSPSPTFLAETNKRMQLQRGKEVGEGKVGKKRRQKNMADLNPSILEITLSTTRFNIPIKTH